MRRRERRRLARDRDLPERLPRHARAGFGLGFLAGWALAPGRAARLSLRAWPSCLSASPAASCGRHRGGAASAAQRGGLVACRRRSSAGSGRSRSVRCSGRCRARTSCSSRSRPWASAAATSTTISRARSARRWSRRASCPATSLPAVSSTGEPATWESRPGRWSRSIPRHPAASANGAIGAT